MPQPDGTHICEFCGAEFTVESYDLRDGSGNWYGVRYIGTHHVPDDCLKRFRFLIDDIGSRRIP